MLGKRGRAPTMKRTTSMKGINVDGPCPLDPPNHVSDEIRSPLAVASDGQHNMYSSSSAMLSPTRYHMRGDSSGDHHLRLQETNPFLKTCALCSRRLAPGRDIYMYRGDTAFCSEECREQQIKQDERKEKSMGKTKNIESHHNHSDITYESSNNGETISAA